jgi:osmoprotectant transport system ATP-binding protein
VITFDHVTKRFGDGTVGVDDLSLDVDDGEVVVLVGPSGCGKTTTMRMVNRMIEPTSGTITIDGEDVRSIDPPTLRRRIGYVIQQTGLFPHRTIAQNIATVPALVGWDKQRTARRVAELVETVGLPQSVADRYPSQLSGGQRQRVGVARALAVDPPIMLMDEPFGAVDPVVRGRLQDEFLRLQAEVHKTIVFVTHDIDEAIIMGDRIAILAEGGVLQQFDTPKAILAAPANDFVADFLGGERGLKRLALITVSEVKAEPGPVVRAGDDRRRAEEIARSVGTDWVVVVDERGMLQGWIALDDIDGRVPPDQSSGLQRFSLRLRATDTLRTALDAMVTSHTGVAVRVKAQEGGDHYEGIITQEILTGEIL